MTVFGLRLSVTSVSSMTDADVADAKRHAW